MEDKYGKQKKTVSMKEGMLMSACFHQALPLRFYLLLQNYSLLFRLLRRGKCGAAIF